VGEGIGEGGGGRNGKRILVERREAIELGNKRVMERNKEWACGLPSCLLRGTKELVISFFLFY